LPSHRRIRVSLFLLLLLVLSPTAQARLADGVRADEFGLS
jgi:hypothetical protein